MAARTLISLRGGDRVQGGGDIVSDLHNAGDAELLPASSASRALISLAVEQVHVGVVIHDGVRQRLWGGREDQIAAAAVRRRWWRTAGAFSPSASLMPV